MDLMQSLVDKINSNDLWERKYYVNKNELLVKEGSVDTHIYFIESGTLRIYVNDNLEELTIRFGYKDNLIAALDCFISGNPTLFNIVALKSSTLNSVSKESFVSLCNADPQAARIWDQILQSLVYQQIEREIDILTASPETRYQRVLKRSPLLFQEIPHKYIASYLRMAPETLSRLKKS